MPDFNFEEIDLLEEEYLYVQPSQIKGAGSGLYTTIQIFKNEIIAIYKGEILTNKEANLRAANGNNLYFMNMPNGKIMDCMQSNNFAKFANDANGLTTLGFTNNAQITINEKTQICLVAKRKIKANEEIFCSYGKHYWGNK